MQKIRDWLHELWHLIQYRSRTAWAICVSFLTLVIPTLLENLHVLQDLFGALNAPSWVRPATTLVGAVATAYALHARVDDSRRGVNLQ